MVPSSLAARSWKYPATSQSLGQPGSLVDVCILFLTILGAAGILIGLVYKEHKTGSATVRTRLLMFLIIGDLTMGLSGVISPLHYLIHDTGPDDATCHAVAFLLLASLWSQYFNAIILAVSTYLVLLHPLSSATRLLQRHWLVLFPAVWVLSFIASGVAWRVTGFGFTGGYCYFGHRGPEFFGDIYSLVPRGIVFIVVVALYGRLFRFLRRPDQIVTSDRSAGGDDGGEADRVPAIGSMVSMGSRRRRLSTDSLEANVPFWRRKCLGRKLPGEIQGSESGSGFKHSSDATNGAAAETLAGSNSSSGGSRGASATATSAAPWEALDLRIPAFVPEPSIYSWSEGASSRRPSPWMTASSKLRAHSLASVHHPLLSHSPPHPLPPTDNATMPPMSLTVDLASPSFPSPSSYFCPLGKTDLPKHPHLLSTSSAEEVSPATRTIALPTFPVDSNSPSSALPLPRSGSDDSAGSQRSKTSFPSESNAFFVNSQRSASSVPTTRPGTIAELLDEESGEKDDDEDGRDDVDDDSLDLEGGRGGGARGRRKNHQQLSLRDVLEIEALASAGSAGVGRNVCGDDGGSGAHSRPANWRGSSGRELVGQESMSSYMNRKASFLMILFPLAYICLFFLSIIRLITDFVVDQPIAILSAISRWMIWSQGIVDALIYGLVEWNVKRDVRRAQNRHYAAAAAGGGGRTGSVGGGSSWNTTSQPVAVSGRPQQKQQEFELPNSPLPPSRGQSS